MWFLYRNAALELLAAFGLHLLVCSAPWLKNVHPARLFLMLEKFLEGVLREKMGFELKRAGVVLIVTCMACAVLAGLLLAPLGWPVRVILLSFAFSCGRLFPYPKQTLEALRLHDLTRARGSLSRYAKVDTDRVNEREATAISILCIGNAFCDACAAPVFWILLGSLIGAAVPCALAWICLDAMDGRIGVRSQTYADIGWFTAKASDALGFVPAWLAGWSVIVASAVLRFPFRRAIRIMGRDHGAHVSPNGGWTVAALSGALGIQLGGDVRIHGVVMHRRLIGDNTKLPETEDLNSALRIVTLAACGALCLAALILALAALI